CLMAQLPAQRAVLLFGEDGDRDFTPRVSEGVELGEFWQAAPLSLSLLRKVREQGIPLLVKDVRNEAGTASLSLLLSNVRSLLCVPFWGPSGRLCGLLYADTQGDQGAFSREHLDASLRLVRQLEEQLEVVRQGGIPRDLRVVVSVPRLA